MASTNIVLRRSLRVINCYSSHTSIKWNYLVPKLHSLSSYSSTFRFSSNLHNGRNNTPIPRVPHEIHSNLPNLPKKRLCNAFVKPCVDIDPLTKLENGIIKVQDNLEEFLSSELPIHSKLTRGRLKNGLRYLILQSEKDPNRFEARLKVHVGSMHEEEDEQGIAHMTEHVLKSDKCQKLLKTGATGGAYTQSYWTVYHLTSQTISEHFDEDLFDGVIVDGDLVPLVLYALNERAFNAKIQASDLEKQRHSVLSEVQMRNTIDERILNQSIKYLHSENKLSRSVGGLEDQIKKWNITDIQNFHKRWYFPGNATLYIVGDINDVSKTIDAIQAAFGKSKISLKKRSSEMENEERITHHNWSLPQSNIDNKKPPEIFRHELITSFSFGIYSKIPVTKFRTYNDLRNFIMKKIYLSVLHFRINAKYKSSNSSSTLRNLHHEDCDVFGCALTNLITISEPKDWKTTIKVAFQEVRKLKEFGINYGEFTLHKDAILKDFAYNITPDGSSTLKLIMDFMIKKDNLGHTVMEERVAHESLAAIAKTITLKETNCIGGKLLEFVSDFGIPSAPVPATIFVCAPTTQEINGEVVEFTINSNEVESAMKQGLEEVIYAEPEIEVPIDLISSSQLQELCLELQPTFIPLISSKKNVKKIHDTENNVIQRRLSNGISVNYMISKVLRDKGLIRVIIGGGKAVESSDLKAAIAVGVQTLNEGGCVGHFSKEQVELYCMKNEIEYSLESTEEFISIKLSFSLRNNGIQAAFQLLHMLLEQSIWLEDAFDRAKRLHLLKFQSNLKSLEQSTTRKLILTMLNGDRRFVEPTQISIQNSTLKYAKEAVLNQLTGNNIKVSIMGDLCETDIECNIVNYLGTIKTTRNFKNEVQQYDPTMYSVYPSLLHSQVYLKDTKERICACIAGLVPNYWGFTIDGKHWLESKLVIERGDSQSNIRDHPLFFTITMEFLTYMINDWLAPILKLGLAYNIKLDLRLFHKLNLGWYMISISSTPSMVPLVLIQCKDALKLFRREEISQKYLDLVRRRMLMRHHNETKFCDYWLKLLCHLHPAASAPGKDISCIKDLTSLYKAVSIEDIYLARDQLKINDDSIYSCIGLAGKYDYTDEISEEYNIAQRLLAT